MASSMRSERELGYLCTFEHMDGDCCVLHQYAPNRESLFHHLRGITCRGTLSPTLAKPVFLGPGWNLKSVVPADFIKVPRDLQVPPRGGWDADEADQ